MTAGRRSARFSRQTTTHADHQLTEQTDLTAAVATRRVSAVLPETPQLRDSISSAPAERIKRHDWATEARRRRRRIAAGVWPRHCCDGRPVHSLEVDGRSTTHDSSSATRKSLSSRQLRAAASTTGLQRVLSLSLHVGVIRHLVLRESFQRSSYTTAVASLGLVSPRGGN